MTYYIYLIQGLIVLSYDKFIGDKKYKWLNKKWALEQESMNFKQTKLHEFVQDRQGKKKKLII